MGTFLVNAFAYHLLWIVLFLAMQALNAIPEQDLFYNVTDALEEQGLEKIIINHMNRKTAEPELLRQFTIYEEVLRHEDGENSQMIDQMEDIRY